MRRLEVLLAVLRASRRRQWWTTFLLVSLLSGLWVLANPLFSGPDEPAHVIRAEAITRGQWTGTEPGAEEAVGGHLEVTVPKIYANIEVDCFKFRRDVPAACQSFEGSSELGPALTSAGRHPPAYYVAVGAASRPYPPGSGSVYLMRLLGVLVTGAFVASAVVALRRVAAPRLAAVGLLVAITPMVLFVSGVVNPSALEIASAIILWVGGFILVTQACDEVRTRLTALVGVASATLVLSRQTGPLWLGLIALSLGALGNRDSLVALLRSGAARVWAGVVAAATLAQVMWLATVKPLDPAILGYPRLEEPSTMLLRHSLGASFGRYRELIGSFGWLDTPAPAPTVVFWTGALGALILLAVSFGPRRDALVIFGLVVASIAVPVALEFSRMREAGGFFWQGRYTLPFAIGVPIVAALSLANASVSQRLLRTPLLPVVGGVLAIAHMLAFAQNLRRNTVGYNGPVWYWRHEAWHPPLPSWLLTLAFLGGILALVAWLLAPDDGEAALMAELSAESHLREAKGSVR